MQMSAMKARFQIAECSPLYQKKDGMILEKRKKHNFIMNNFKDIKVAVAETGYVRLSIATLLSQHQHVTALDIIPEKVEKLNNKISPIQDDYIEKYCYIAAA